MMKQRIFTAIMAMALCLTASAFGRIGHDAVAAIAENNLTPTAKATIEKYLDGKSIVYYASWMDNVRLQPAYKHTDGWHSASFDANGKSKVWKDRYRSNLGINTEMAKVENGKYKQMTDSAVAVSIKVLVHLVGDMHCPGHCFFEDKSQNVYFYLNGDEKWKFHKFFDGGVFDKGHKWYYADYVYQLDRCSDAEKADMVKGSLIDWEEGNAAIMRPLYDIITPERKFDKAETFDFVQDMVHLTDSQILKAGYRLAHVLNSVFDPSYAPKWQRQ
ncbi:S1/P1 nuclease [uncultured Muribaculum sp.]|uniref:S1/P1 nuclease n=2 Tax=uncultured Muribaculum sp. TaxID=1918613 RepID=UPI0025FE24C8|nr:S1/P1 nuclease [uncultured Muribaculum sp.]